MIIKSLSRKSNTGQLVRYILRYIIDKEQTNEIAKDPPFILRHNIRSETLKGFIDEFKENEKYRLIKRKDSVKIHHNIISFSNKDNEHIDDQMLKDIFERFVEVRGNDSLYVGTKHEDKNHIHLHIAISGTKINGRSSRISKSRLQQIKLELDNFQKEKFPALINSLPEHGKAKGKEAILNRVKDSRQTDKAKVMQVIHSFYDTSSSSETLAEKLHQHGYPTYHRNGKLQGILCDGKKFRFSRLGINSGDLEKTNMQMNQQQVQLSNLQKLRSRPVQKIPRTVNTEITPAPNTECVNDLQDHSLAALAKLRYKKTLVQERSADTDDLGRGLDLDSPNDADPDVPSFMTEGMSAFGGFPTILKPINNGK